MLIEAKTDVIGSLFSERLEVETRGPKSNVLGSPPINQHPGTN